MDTPEKQRIVPMRTGQADFLLLRMGADCGPLQQIRELTQNAIEAVLRTPEKKGKIRWDVDYELYNAMKEVAPGKEDSVPQKLCVIDDGIGMTGPDLVHYINALSQSSTDQSLQGNYGVGAKIAAATRNPVGLVYDSWNNGTGSRIHFMRTEEGKYGLKEYRLGEDTWGHVIELSDAAKPKDIKTRGTKVTLLGNSDGEETVRPPDGTPLPSAWIVPYLNTRYFVFPDGVEVYGSEMWKTPHYTSRRAFGQKHFLEQHKTATGSVKLTDATAHWWILEKDSFRENTRLRMEYAARHHVAALYQNELYEITGAGRASTSRLQQFGIIWGYRRVVIYVEPTRKDLTTNTARTQLITNREALPWDDWAYEFRSQMPEELLKLMDEESLKDDSADQSQTIQDRLKKVQHLYKMSRYLVIETGPEMSDPESEITETMTTEKKKLQNDLFQNEIVELPGTDEEGNGKKRRKRRRKENWEDILLRCQKKKNGDKSTEVESTKYPKVVWIDLASKSRSKEDLEDRPARFVPSAFMIQANGDFRVFEDMVKVIMQERKFTGAAKEKIVRDCVREWFGVALTETVVGLLALNGPKWSQEERDRSLSEEGLTSSVMQKYHVYNSVRRHIGTRFGPIGDELDDTQDKKNGKGGA